MAAFNENLKSGPSVYPKNLNINGLTLSQQMASSSAGAMLVSLFMTPLDVVKIRLQAQDRLRSKKCFLYSNGQMDHLHYRTNGEPIPKVTHTAEEICNCTWYNRPKYFEGTWDAFLRIRKVEGYRSLWSGLTPTLVLALPTTVLYLTTYENLKKVFATNISNPEQKMVYISLLSGALGRTLAVSVVSPLELIRTKMQSQKMKFSEVRTATMITLKNERVFGLWKGLGATLIRDVPFSGIYWGCYESMRPVEFDFGKTFVAGAVAGSVASTVTLPMDVIKTRIQIELGETGVKMNSLQLAREILDSQGVKGLFAGLIPRLLKVAPACAIMISSYEFCKQYFRQKNTSH